MEKKIAIGLIKLDVLNNIDTQDSEALQYLKRNDDDFPWKELGDYQNLVALLAVTSKIDEPDSNLKAKILERLYNFKSAAPSDNIFESVEEQNHINENYSEETTQKFKVETNGESSSLNQGPMVEIEEYEIDSAMNTRNTSENILEEKSAPKVQKQTETHYEIEEYDLELSHENVEPSTVDTPVIHEVIPVVPEKVENSLYEIEEYDLELKEHNESGIHTEEIIKEVLPVKVDAEPGISIQQPEEDNESKIVPQNIVQTNLIEEQVVLKDVDDVTIYNENEAVEQITSEILDNVGDTTSEIVSSPEVPKFLTNDKSKTEITGAPNSNKSNLEKNKPLKTEPNGDSISFREPNLSQLHILFKDNQDLAAKEKETRLEYRAKIVKEQSDKTVKQVNNKSQQVIEQKEIKPLVETKPVEPELVMEPVPILEADKPVADSSTEKVKSPVKLKNNSDKKSFKKVAVVAAAIVIICASVLFFMQSSDEVKGEQVNITNAEQTPTSYENVVEEKKPEGLIIVEDIVPVKQKKVEITQPKDKLPSPPKQPTPIEPEIVVDNKKDNSSTIVKESTEPIKKEVKLAPPKEEKKREEEPTYFVAVEEMPSPIGGLAGIQKRVYYPNIAKLAGVEGKVLVLAYVNESGNVTKVELVKGIGAGCDEVALDAVRQTKFTPGIQRGKHVKVRVTIPIVFKKS